MNFNFTILLYNCKIIFHVKFSCHTIVYLHVIFHRVKKQIRLPFDSEVCSLCGVENNSTMDDEAVWLFAVTPTGIAIL